MSEVTNCLDLKGLNDSMRLGASHCADEETQSTEKLRNIHRVTEIEIQLGFCPVVSDTVVSVFPTALNCLW